MPRKKTRGTYFAQLLATLELIMPIIKQLILVNAAALCFVMVTFIGLYYISGQLEQSNNKVDYSAANIKVKSSSDIQWLKDGMLMALEHRKIAHDDMAHSYVSFTYLLPAFSIFYIANIYLLIKLRNKNSNKSSNLTGAENAPPS